MDKEPDERKATLQDLFFFVDKFEGHTTGVGYDLNYREEQENNARTN